MDRRKAVSKRLIICGVLFSACCIALPMPETLFAQVEEDRVAQAAEVQHKPPETPEPDSAFPPVEEAEMEEVVVIGSRLRRRDFSAPSPIITVPREAFEFTGQKTLETALGQMPQFTPTFDRTVNFNGNGQAYINLRGLGPQRTLVMLNGRRLSPSGVGSAVDVNNLPQALIESAEIITGGASAVYGSDAVAGVVNFTIREDFEGFGLDASTYITEEGDSNINDLSMAWGHNFANGRGNITVFGGWYDRDETYAGDREITSVTWQDLFFFGELVQIGSPAVPEGLLADPAVDHGDGAAWTIWTPDGDPRAFVEPDDYFNPAPWQYLQIPMKRKNVGLMFNYDLNEHIEVYGEASYSSSVTEMALAPTQAREYLLVNYDNPVLTPATRQLFEENLYPVEVDAGIGFFLRRFEEFGPASREVTNDYTRLLAGLRGDLGSNWEYDAWIIYSENDEQDLFFNDGSISRLQQGLLVDPATGQCFDSSGGCVPLDIFGPGRLSDAAVDFLRLRPLLERTDRTQLLVSGYARGALFDAWAGPLEAVVGGEWREDKGSYVAAEALVDGDAMNYFPFPPVDGKEEVIEAFVELLLPLAVGRTMADYLAVEAGYRFSHYEYAGDADTYKAGVEWRPIPSLAFRGMFQRAVRAPNLEEAFLEQQVYQDFFAYEPTDDPCSAASDPVGSGNVEKCIATGLPADQIGVFEASQFPTDFIYGGNPDLQSEEADTITLGIVITPEAWPNLSFSVDYFDIELNGEIGPLAAVEACFDPANEGVLFCDNISRNTLNYNVDEVREYNINRGVARTSGVDTQLSYVAMLPSALAIGDNAAQLRINAVWSHVLELTTQNTPFSSVTDCAGTFGWPCRELIDGMTWPTDRVIGRFDYVSGKFTANLTWRWVDRTKNGIYEGAPLVGIDPADLNSAVPYAAAKNYFDVSFSYLFGEHVLGLLTVANVTDTDPPMMAQWSVTKNTDTRMYDIFGRSYTLTISLRY